MLISDDPRARSYAKREFWRGYRYGVAVATLGACLVVLIIHYVFSY